MLPPRARCSTTDLEAIDVGKADVEHGQVVLVHGECGESVAAGRRDVGRHGGFAQRAPQQVGEGRVVFDDEDAHEIVYAKGDKS